MDNHIFPFLWMRGEEESVIRKEMEKISEAGIKSVCLEARPHPEYAGEKWWHDVDIVIDEAKKRNMTIWILDDAHFPTGMANDGMKRHPEKCRRFIYTQFVDVTGPVPSAQVDVNLLMERQITWMDLGKPITKPLYDETKLLSVTASKISYGDEIEGDPIDVTKFVKDGYLTWDVPKGTWRINVNFSTTDFGPKPEYVNYIEADSVRVLIDEVYEKHYERYKDLFGTVIEGFFSDEPGFYNNNSFGEDNHVGLKMTLPWGKEMDELMKKTYGDNLYRDIPFLYATEVSGKQTKIRFDYMNCVSELYGKNFNKQLGDWCRAHGVRYIGHIVEDSYGHMRLGAGIGHYFRAMSGQDMSGIDNIGYQIMPGNDVANRHTGFQDLNPDFYHYQLGKLGGSDAAIDPRKNGRCMCENFGAYGWRLGVRDMKWLVDYLVGQGVNYFVPHAFSMAEYPDNDCPPHFYARGNNPQFPFFCDLMKYTDRLCNLFSEGKNVPQVAVLYEAEADWAGNTMRGCTVSKELTNHQIDFEFVPADVFANADYYGCKVEDGILEVNGRSMKALIIPECEYITSTAVEFIKNNPELKVIFVNVKPIGVVGDANADLASTIEKAEVVSLENLSKYLCENGIKDELYPENCDKNLHIYHYNKDNLEIYLLFNASLSDEVNVVLNLPESKYGRYDAMEDKTYNFDVENGKAEISLNPYQSIILVTNLDNTEPANEVGELNKEIAINSCDLTLKEIGSSEAEEIKDFTLAPVSALRPDFSGIMTYKTKFEVDELPKSATFSAQYVYECMSVTVNGKKVKDVIVPPYACDITSALKVGENEIEISVASTALRNANTKPGIFGKERTIIEPTGMFGEVGVKLYN